MLKIATLMILATMSTGPDLAGTYLLDKKHSDDPSHAVDDATESMGRFRRNAARKKIGEALKPSDTLRISASGDTIALATSGRLHLTTVPGAEAKTRTGEKGSIEVSSAWVGDTLVVRTTSDRFQREARYSLEEGGAAIRVSITMSGGGSGEPIHYALVYRRTETTAGSS
jgi:hypothetical protein